MPLVAGCAPYMDGAGGAPQPVQLLRAFWLLRDLNMIIPLPGRRMSHIEQARLHRFISAMPKAELHLHIEGTLEPEMMMALAIRNGVTLPYASLAAIRDAYDFKSLQDFLDLYYTGMSVLRTRQDFFDL